MKITKQYLKQVILEETRKFLKEANNFDSKTGQPLTDDAWIKGRDYFFNTDFGKMWFNVHKQNGGKFDSKTGVPVGGLRDIPSTTWHQLAGMVKQQTINTEKAKQQMDAYYDKAEQQGASRQTALQATAKKSDEKAKNLQSDLEQKLINKLGGGKFVDGKYVPTSPEERQQTQSAANKQIQDELNKQVSLLKNLKVELQKAPDKPSAQEKQLFNSIIKPHFDKVDKITNDADKIQSPQELRNYMTNVWRPAIKETTPTIMKYYQEVKKTGQIISKPYMEIIIDSIQSDVNNLQNSLKNK